MEKDRTQELVDLALEARGNAYCPYSNYRVGAALLCADGRIFTGCNVENASYPCTICAERVAASKAVSEGERDFVAIAVAGSSDSFCTPCGMCRQFLSEFNPRLRVICVAGDGRYEVHHLNDLLPFSFDKSDLN